MREDSENKIWIDYMAPVFDGRAQEIWFRWIGWVLVASAVIAIGESTNSVVLKVLGWASSLFAFCYFLFRIEDLAKFLSSKIRGPWVLSFLLFAGVQLVLSFSAANALNAIIDSSSAIGATSANDCKSTERKGDQI